MLAIGMLGILLTNFKSDGYLWQILEGKGYFDKFQRHEILNKEKSLIILNICFQWSKIFLIITENICFLKNRKNYWLPARPVLLRTWPYRIVWICLVVLKKRPSSNSVVNAETELKYGREEGRANPQLECRSVGLAIAAQRRRGSSDQYSGEVRSGLGCIFLHTQGNWGMYFYLFFPPLRLLHGAVR